MRAVYNMRSSKNIKSADVNWEKELKFLYKDWKILKFNKKSVRLFIRGDHGEALYNSMFKMLAQKPNI